MHENINKHRKQHNKQEKKVVNHKKRCFADLTEQKEKVKTNIEKKEKKLVVYHVKLNQGLIEYANQNIRIMRNVRYNGVPLGMKEDISITGLMRKGLLMLLNLYSKKILSNDSVVQRFEILNNDVLSGFIAFRAKYLDMSVDKQLDNFVKMGIIRKFQNNVKSNKKDN